MTNSPHSSVLIPYSHHMLYLPHTLGHKRRQVLHIHTSIRPLPQLQPLFVVLAQQVPDLLLVNLQIGRSYQILLVVRARNVSEDVIKGVWNDPTFVGNVTIAWK